MELETEGQSQNHQEQEGQLHQNRRCELFQPQVVVEDNGNICNKYPVRNTGDPAFSVNTDRTVNMEINSANELSIAEQPSTVAKPKTKSKKHLRLENRRLKNTVKLQKARIKKLQSKLQKMEATVTKLENTIDEKLEDLVERKVNQRWTQIPRGAPDSPKCTQLTSSDAQASVSTSGEKSKNKTKKLFEMKVCKYCIIEEKILDNVVKTYTNGSQIDELKLEKCYSHEHKIQSSKNKFKRQPSFMMVAKVVFKLCGNNIKTFIVSADIGDTSESRSEWYHSITYLLTMMPNIEELHFKEPVWTFPGCDCCGTTSYTTNAKYQNISNGTEKTVLQNLQNFVIHVDGFKSTLDKAMGEASNGFLQQLEAPNLKTLLIKYEGHRDRQDSVLPPIYKLVANYQASLHALELQEIELVHLDQFPPLPCLKTLKIELKFDAMTDNPNQIQTMLLPLQDLEHLEVTQRHYHLALEVIGHRCAPGCNVNRVRIVDKGRFKKIERVFIKEMWERLPQLKTVIIIFSHFIGCANTKFQASRS